MVDQVEKVTRVETATEKLRALRHLCDVSSQPFYVEIIDEVLAAFAPVECDGIWEVRPCVNRLGHVTSYDICPPVSPDAPAGPVIASVFDEATANEIARLWNTRIAYNPNERLREALEAAWTDFLDANPDGITSPEEYPDHALVTCDQMISIVDAALAHTSPSGLK